MVAQDSNKRRLTHDEGRIEHASTNRCIEPIDQPFPDKVAENAASPAMAGCDGDGGEHWSVSVHVVVVVTMLQAMATVFIRRV